MRRLLAIFAFTTLAWLDLLPSLPVVSGGLPEEGKPNGSAVEAQAYPSRMTGISEVESSRRETASNTTTPVPSEETQTGAATSSKPSTVQAQSAVNRKRRDVSDEDNSSPFVTKEEAEKLAFDSASKIVKQLNENSTQKKLWTSLKEAAQTIVSENEDHIMRVNVLGGRGRKPQKSSGQFSTNTWIQHAADYATKQASGTARQGRFSVTVNVQYAERPKPVVGPLLPPSPNVDTDGKRPEQSAFKKFSTDMGLSLDEAVDFSYDIATAVAADFKERQLSQEEIPARLALWNEHIVSKNPHLAFRLSMRGGRHLGGLSFGPETETSIWKDHRSSVSSELISGVAVDGGYSVQVFLEAAKRPAPRQKVPSLGMKIELPPFLDDSVADAFAKKTAEVIARSFQEEQASHSFIDAALEKWAKEITSEHSKSCYNLRVTGSSGTTVHIREGHSPTMKWLSDRPTNTKTAYAKVQAGNYTVRVYVDYADNSD